METGKYVILHEIFHTQSFTNNSVERVKDERNKERERGGGGERKSIESSIREVAATLSHWGGRSRDEGGGISRMFTSEMEEDRERWEVKGRVGGRTKIFCSVACHFGPQAALAGRQGWRPAGRTKKEEKDGSCRTFANSIQSLPPQ